MGRKLSEDKQNLLRKRILQECTIKQIAEELQISEKTVQRYKKKSPAPYYKEQDTGDNLIKFDYTTSLTRMEELFTKRIEKEISLYEDDEEGWTFHLSKHDMRIKQSGLWWNMIVYPESAPPDWIESLKRQGFGIAISPLHDKDTWNHDSPEMVNAETGEVISKGTRYKTGGRKKAHWHVIILCRQRTGYTEMNSLLRNITNCPYIQKCRSLKNAYDYFLHINAPEKYQGYDKEEIQRYNDFHVEPNKYESNIMLDEVLSVIIDMKLTRWIDVINLYRGQIEYILILNSKPHVVTQILNENWRVEHPEGSIKKIKIVKDENNKDLKGKV